MQAGTVFNVVTVATEADRSVILNPNPTNGMISLLNLPEGATPLRIFSVLEQEIPTGFLPAGNKRLNQDKLLRGTYLLR